MSEIAIIWSLQAADDVTRIKDFISRSSPRFGQLVAGRIVDAVEHLRLFPESGRIVPELDVPTVREVIHADYRILYEIQGAGRIEILTVFRGTRQFPPR